MKNAVVMVVLIFLNHNDLCGWVISSSWPSLDVIHDKIILKAFFDSSVENLTKIYRIEIILKRMHQSFSTHIGAIYALTQWNCTIFFPSANWGEWKPNVRLTRRSLNYGWTTNLSSLRWSKQRKNQSSAAREREDKRRRQPSTWQKKIHFQVQIIFRQRNQ